MALGPGRWEVWLGAGPRYQRAHKDLWEVRNQGEPQQWAPILTAQVAATGWVLARLDVETWPSRGSRQSPQQALALAAADGVSFAVSTAVDEITEAQVDQPWARRVRCRSGSTTASPDAGTVLTWPWSGNKKRPAHGAADWRGLTAEDMLQVASGGAKKDRLLVVEGDWLAAAGSSFAWDPVPDLFYLERVEDYPLAVELWDGWVDVGVVGPWTWVITEDPERFSAVEVERGLIQSETIATTGPFIDLAVAGAGPGAWVQRDGLLLLELQVWAPDWMPLTGAGLIVDGEMVATWDLSAQQQALRLEDRRLIETTAYVVALAWGDEDPGPSGRGPAWAITSPVWTGAP